MCFAKKSPPAFAGGDDRDGFPFVEYQDLLGTAKPTVSLVLSLMV